MCEAYQGLKPQDIQQMTMGQIYLLCIDADLLKGEGTGVITMTPDEAIAAGLVEDTGGKSLVQLTRERLEREQREAERERRREKKRRKQERIRAARAKAQQQPEKQEG